MAWARKCTNEARDPDHAHLGDSVFYVDGKPIDFVSSFPQLAHVITDTLDDGPDITKRFGNFTGQVNDVLCFFGMVSCDKIRIIIAMAVYILIYIYSFKQIKQTRYDYA